MKVQSQRTRRLNVLSLRILVALALTEAVGIMALLPAARGFAASTSTSSVRKSTPTPVHVSPTPTNVVTPTPTKAVTPTPPSLPAPDQYQQKLLNLINTSRSQKGLKPYVFSGAMSLGAGTCIGSLGHSIHMAQLNAISHDQFASDVCFAWHSAGENVGLASGTETQAISYMENQMMADGAIGGHYQNLMSTTYTTVGLGLYSINGYTWLTEDFAA